MTDSRTAAVNYTKANEERFLQELKDFCSIASISTDPGALPEMARSAQWLADHFKKLNLDNIQIIPTPGHPVVYAENLSAGPQAPTVLIYGHYDVQPAEPLDLWTSAPFEPTIRSEHIFARGVTDMKGQILATVNAFEAIFRTGVLPVNIKFIIEGEEEIGSPSLPQFIRQHIDLLKCDISLNPDTGTLSAEIPCITYALRGMAYFELRVHGPDHDLHSGTFGGGVLNPAQALCELIAGMHNPDGSIALPGFYDRVRHLDEEERRELARLPMQDDWVLANTGAPGVWGEQGYSSVERMSARPTLEVNGLYSGFTGEGSKTVLPAWAMAKISCRLVPDQDPDDVHQQMIAYLNAHAPAVIRWELKKMTGGPAAISDRRSPGVIALVKAMETVWGVRPLFKREGGSVPVVTWFQQILGVESVNTGFAMPGDNLHSPNEMLHLPTWKLGTQALVHFFFNLAEG